VRRSAPGEYAVEVRDLRPDQAYEFRAMAKHPLVTTHGEDGVLPAAGRVNR
jgi:hypothetical protein